MAFFIVIELFLNLIVVRVYCFNRHKIANKNFYAIFNHVRWDELFFLIFIDMFLSKRTFGKDKFFGIKG